MRRSGLHQLDPGAGAVGGQVVTYDEAANRLRLMDPTGGGGGATGAVGDLDVAHHINVSDPLDRRITEREVLVGTWATAFGGSPAVTFLYNTSNAQNDSFGLTVWLGAGTYKLVVVCSTDINRAIQTWEIDAGDGTYTSLGTLDWYTANQGYSVVKTLSFTVTGDVVKRTLRARSATRNASSTGWYQGVQGLRVVRIA